MVASLWSVPGLVSTKGGGYVCVTRYVRDGRRESFTGTRAQVQALRDYLARVLRITTTMEVA